MARWERAWSRRKWLLANAAGFAAPLLVAQDHAGSTFPSAIKRYSDPATEFDVYRLTDPAFTSILPAPYNRAIARSGGWMIFAGDRGGSLQAFRIDLKTGETRELTSAENLDAGSLTLTPDNRSFCYFAGRSLFSSMIGGRTREIYKIPDGWERTAGFSVGAGDKSRWLVTLAVLQPPARQTVRVMIPA